MTKKHYNFFYLLLIYFFINSLLWVNFLYETYHNQTSLVELKWLVYGSFLINLLFIFVTAIYMGFKFKTAADNVNMPIHKSLLQLSQFQHIMDKIRVGIIITDSNGIIKFANHQAACITEFEVEEMKQKHYLKIFTLLHSNNEKNSRFIIEKALENGCVVSNKLPRTIICKNNRKKEILSSANPIFEKNNEISGVILSFLDVTDDFSKIRNISQENKKLNETFSTAKLCYFKKNLITNKITGADNLSHFWAFHSDKTAYSDEEWVFPADLSNYQISLNNFLHSDMKYTEIIYRSNYYSKLKYFYQIIYKTDEDNVLSGVIQDITDFVNWSALDENISFNSNMLRAVPVAEKKLSRPQKLSILIVDYEINNCNVLALVFTKLNYNVRVTTTPNSALEYLKNCKVDIILANLELPNMNAVEFAKEVRIHFGFDIMIYVILNDEASKDRLNLHIFNGILVKPITPEQIKKIF